MKRSSVKAAAGRQEARQGWKAGGNPEKAFRNWVLFLLVAVVAAYANHFFNGFHFDDFHTIVNNAYIRSLRNIPRFFVDGTTFSSLPANQSYRPIVSTTLAIDYFLGHGSLFFFHLSTFLLFLFQGVVMYHLYLSIFDRSQRGAENSYVALIAVAWYLLHPANAETINYILARSDSLSTLFILLSFAVYIRWDFGRRRHLYLIPFALSCLAKPIGAIFAPLLLLYVYLFEETAGSRLRRLAASLKKSIPSFAACLLLLTFIKKMDPPTWRAGGGSLFHYVITQPYVLLQYFITFFAPLHLSADTDWRPLASVFDIRFLAGILFLVGLVAVACLSAKTMRLRPISFGLFWFLLTLLPTSLIPLAEVMNDHRLFLPYVGLVVSVCWAAYLLLEGAKSRIGSDTHFLRVTTTLILVALAACGYETHVRNAVWHSELSLWRDVTIKSPHNGRGLMNYGVALMDQGHYADAETYFHKAMKYVPRYAYLYVNLGIVEAKTGKLVEAQNDYQKAIMLDPNWPGGYYWYGDFLKKQKRYDDAIFYTKRALQMSPANLDARKLLMAIYLECGKLTDLKALAKQTLQIFPGDAQAEKSLAAAEEGIKRLQQ
ncbi:MAG TPA: tetratricopeptide repeat protein [Desulfuromonadales bacterium]|nr:tetratricopeptide repeat protein [Desulfuromonadales bacterium]